MLLQFFHLFSINKFILTNNKQLVNGWIQKHYKINIKRILKTLINRQIFKLKFLQINSTKYNQEQEKALYYIQHTNKQTNKDILFNFYLQIYIIDENIQRDGYQLIINPKYLGVVIFNNHKGDFKFLIVLITSFQIQKPLIIQQKTLLHFIATIHNILFCKVEKSMSDCSVNSEPEPSHPDMSMNYESNLDKSQRTKNDSNTNRNTSIRRDLEIKASVDNNRDLRFNQADDQCYEEDINLEQNNLQKQQVNMVKQQQQINSDSQAINAFKRKKIDASQVGKSKDFVNENFRQSNDGLKEIQSQNQAHNLKLEFIQIDNDVLNIEDPNEFFQENGIKKKAIGKSISQRKNGSINSQNSIISPQSATTNQINFQVQPPSYYFGDIKKDTLKQKQQLQQQQINQVQQHQQQSNQLQQVLQQQQGQNQNQQEEIRHKFRITNTSERASSNIKERIHTHSNQNNITNQSQNENNANENQEEDIENFNTNNIDYSVLSAYVNSNNQFSEHDHLNKLYDKDTSPFKKQSYTTKLAQQFDVKNNPYAIRPYSMDKGSQKRVKNILNNSMNSKIGQNPIQNQIQNNQNDDAVQEKQKKTENSQNPSVIIINQIQGSENSNQKNFSNTANNIYKQTLSQLENLKAIDPQLQQQQSPIEKYVNVIKSQMNNQNTETKASNLTKSPIINKQNLQQTTQFVEFQKTFQSGNKKSVPDVLNNTSNIQNKQNVMNMQRRVSQPHQRSITQDKYDEIIKSVLHPEKKNTQAKAPEFRTNAISELKKQLNQMSGELEFERLKNQELYNKLQSFRQKCLGKIDRQTKLLAKNEFEAEILHVEQKVKALKKKIKQKDEELVLLKDESEKQHAILQDYEKLKFEVSQYKENVENLMIKLDTKEKSIQELHRAHNNANADIERLFQETSSLKQKVDEKQGEIDQLEGSLKVANIKAQEANKLRQDIEVYKISQMQSNQMRLDAEKKKKEYEQKLSEFNKVKEENISLKLEMEHQCSQLKDQLQKSNFEWKQLQLTAQKLSKEKEQFNQILKEEQQKRDQLRSEVQRLQSELNQINNQNKEDLIIQQNNKLKTENTNLRQENLALKGEVVKWQNKKQETDNESQNLKKQVHEFKLQIDDLNSKIKEYNQSTMRVQDADKLKNEFIILQREKDNMQQFYEQQIKDLKLQLNNEIRQTQIYSIKLENLVKDSKLQNFTNTTPILVNRRDQVDISGNTSPVRSNTKKHQTNNNNDFNQQEHVSLSQKYSTKNSLYIEKKLSDCD
ncbi:hypothetical protein TTHERM_00254590 (macronuclear) [Tetrahymena thermophila SB210]|uniref:Uncharacterized protein n=1 Tax=Tetrahymena thermophila (strain SB210) TaxID=312017 RepID=Q23QM1_TETTS|nr:hypothetical protein TTHERM_00254590 [Tetrahymena thermophila SB210]EAR98867.2 hypothetical protein TTHERM_00254590 [Tetrahymena thermophila SB210]|eukprot:XP_001019112.2 hypothetical protein TTHERM_00254590 [Tetrahymena thermophila SB210]